MIPMKSKRTWWWSGCFVELNEERRKRHAGSTLERCFVYRDREGGAKRLFHYYSMDNLVFDDAIF